MKTTKLIKVKDSIFRYVFGFGDARIAGITLFPFIFVPKDKFNRFSKMEVQVLENTGKADGGTTTMDQIIKNHENIHWYQQLELLIIPFYLIYILNWLYLGIFKYKGRNWTLAYQNIIFEKEAYDNEYEVGYLERRKIWSFLKYLRQK